MSNLLIRSSARAMTRITAVSSGRSGALLQPSPVSLTVVPVKNLSWIVEKIFSTRKGWFLGKNPYFSLDIFTPQLHNTWIMIWANSMLYIVGILGTYICIHAFANHYDIVRENWATGGHTRDFDGYADVKHWPKNDSEQLDANKIALALLSDDNPNRTRFVSKKEWATIGGRPGGI